MPGSITWAAKSAGILRLDRFLQTPSPSFIPVLRNSTDVFHRMRSDAIVDDAQKDHINDHILGTGWWPESPTGAVDKKSDILRAAYIKAIELATEAGPANPPKPIVTYHIKGLPKGTFEVMVARTDREIHVLWLTPARPGEEKLPAGSTVESQEMWLVGSEGRVQAIHQKYWDGGHPDPEPETVEGVDGVLVLEVGAY